MFKHIFVGRLGLFLGISVLTSACAIGEIGDSPGAPGLDPGFNDAALTCPGVNPDVSASDGWQSKQASQPAPDALYFEVMARPTEANLDALVAVGAQDIHDVSDAAITVRFSDTGVVDVMDDSDYSSDGAFEYDAGVWYDIAISADVTARTYDVEVGRCGEKRRSVIRGARFRAASNVYDRLSTWGVWSSRLAELQLSTPTWMASGTCAPATCESLGAACGEPSDGCGGTLSCGGCTNGQACASGVCENASPPPPPSCEPLTCVSSGFECGVWGDGCGGNLNCGGCRSGQACTSGVCENASSLPPPSCEPLTCMSSGFECGVWSDGCGGSLSCGGCASGQACSGGSCVDVSPPPPPPSCERLTCVSLGVDCGNWSDGCGGNLSCGGCASGQVCTSGVCEDVSPPPPISCAPLACSDIGAQCGNQANGCGGTINCGTCGGGNICTNGECSPAGSNQFFASRTSCMAPCGVRFDAQPTENLSWAEVRDQRFVWDFDDAGAGSEGFAAAHMFEKPGTYNVSVTVDGTAWASKAITVRAPSRTVCVSPNSSFGSCPSASGSDHFTTIGAAYAAVGTNTHILLERGKSHGALPGSGAAGQSGSYLLGAYGTGAKPRVTSDDRRPRSGWTFQDLNVSTVGGDSYNFTADAMDHVVFHRIDSTDNARRFVSMFATGPTNWMFFENNLVKGEYVMFACCTGIVIKGNSITRTGTYGGPQHAIRIAGTDHALVQDNVFDAQAPHTSLALRGGEPVRNGSNWVLVQGNTFDKHTMCGPQNDTSSGVEQHIVWEKNRYNLDTVGGCTTCSAGRFTGHDMVVRDNTVGGQYSGGLSVRPHPLVQNQGIEFSNNTMQ